MAEMTIEKAIGIISFARNHRKECGVAASDFDHAIDVALTALCEKQERETPLTWEQLKTEKGNPIWSEKTGWVFLTTFKDAPYKQIWYLRNRGEYSTVLFDHTKFYRNKPERSAE